MEARPTTATRKTPATSRRRLSSQQRRDVLLAAGARVFAEYGFHAAPMEEIARQAGVTKPVIYHHFGSKQELHRAVFEHYAQRLLQTAASHGRHGSPRERLRDLVRGMFAFAHENPHVWKLLLGDSNDPETALLQQQLRATGTQQSAARLLATSGYQPTGALSRKKAAEATAELIRSAVDGLITWSLRHPKVFQAALADTATDLLWNGLEKIAEYEGPRASQA